MAQRKLGVGKVVPTWYGGTITASTLGIRTAQLSYYPPRWFSPLLSFVHFYVPWDRATLYQWIRYFDTWHPVVGACVDIHTMMPLSRFSLRGIHDPDVLRVYEQCCEELKAFLLMYSQLQEYWTIGEVFTLLYWDNKLGIFTDAEIIMPEYVEIKSMPFIGSFDIEKNIYELVLDQFTMEVLESPDPDIQRMLSKLDPAILQAIKSKGRVRLDGNLLMVMIKKRHMYQDRAQPIILRVMRELIYESKLLEAMYTIAERHVNPKEIWRIGDKDFPPDQALIDSYEELIRNAEQQPLFTLVVPYNVSLEIVGATGKFPKLSDELDWVEKRILTAMLLNKAVIHGEGPCVSEDTLILTDKGFMSKDEAVEHVKQGGKIAQYNPDTDKVEFVKPLGFMEKDFEGYMHYYKSSHVDHLVTPDHNLWVSSVRGVNWKKIKSEDLTYKRFKFRGAADIECPYVTDNVVVIGGKEIEFEKLIELIGFYISEGSLDVVKFKDGTIVPISIRITQQVSGKAYERIKRLMHYLKSKGFIVVDRVWAIKDNNHDWRIFNTDLAQFILDNCGRKHTDKFLSDRFKFLQKPLAKKLLEACVLGDGHVYTDNVIEYYTVSKRLAEDILLVALHAGYFAYIKKRKRKGRRTLYRVRILKRRVFELSKKNHFKKVYYKGKVYSFGVPTGLIVVMRNGKPVITGNTYATASVAMRALMQRYMEVRAMLEEEWETKVFLPIALKHNFFEITQAELEHGVRRPYKDRKPIIPHFDWQYKARLVDDTDFRNRIIDLYRAGKLPLKVLTDVLGLDYEYIKIYKEREEGTIFDPFYEEWKKQVIAKGLEGIVPSPKGVRGSVEEVDKKRLDEMLEEADRRYEIFKKYFERKARKEKEDLKEKKPVGEKEEDITSEEKEKKVRKILEEASRIEFDWTTRGGLLRKLRIAEEIFKRGNLDLLTAILPREVKTEGGEDGKEGL